jgi:hypothetical protein
VSLALRALRLRQPLTRELERREHREPSSARERRAIVHPAVHCLKRHAESPSEFALRDVCLGKRSDEAAGGDSFLIREWLWHVEHGAENLAHVLGIDDLEHDDLEHDDLEHDVLVGGRMAKVNGTGTARYWTAVGRRARRGWNTSKAGAREYFEHHAPTGIATDTLAAQVDEGARDLDTALSNLAYVVVRAQLAAKKSGHDRLPAEAGPLVSELAALGPVLALAVEVADRLRAMCEDEEAATTTKGAAA